MGKRVERKITVSDADGVQHVFEKGDEVPDELVERIDNPAAWEADEIVEDPSQVGVVASESPQPTGIADAPYAGPPVDVPETVTPMSGEPAFSQVTDGSSSEDEAPADTVPSAAELEGMTRADLDGVAESLGLSTAGMRKDEVRAAIESRRGTAS